MTQPNPYQNLVSPRSRRLRTVGVMLLVAVVLMTVYGVLGIQPGMRAAAREYKAATIRAAATVGPNGMPARPSRQVRRVMQVKLLFADFYWLTCGILALGAIIAAWLDFREVSRNYLAERHALLGESGRRVPPPEGTSE